MKRSFFTVAAAVTALTVAACGPGDTTNDIEPVEEVQPAPMPAPAPAPQPLPGDTMMMQDTLGQDTLGAPGTTGQ
jgi:hypothetical protein